MGSGPDNGFLETYQQIIHAFIHNLLICFEDKV